MSSKNDDEINWNEVVGKEALGENGLDIGTIKDVADDYIVTEVGMLKKKIYHLPKSSAKYFNGVFLNFSLNESDLSTYELKIGEGAFSEDSISGLQDMAAKKEMLIPLISEDLKVTKTIIEDNIRIVKEPIKETKTVRIELRYEKVTIERKEVSMNDVMLDKGTNINLSNSKTSNEGRNQESDIEGSMYSKTEFSIPIKKEEPLITKKSFVREELVINKKPVTETKTIAEEITKEEVKYDNQVIEKSKDLKG